MAHSDSSGSAPPANPNGSLGGSFLRFPNDIPPRVSSSHTTTAGQYGTAPPAPRPKSTVLPSVPESDWLAGKGPAAAAVGASSLNASSCLGYSRNISRKASVTSLGPPQPPPPTSFLPVTMTQPPPPPPDPSRFATEDFNFSAKRTWSEDKEKVLMGPFDYLDNHKGKDFRSHMIKAFDAWLNVPPESLEIITKVVGMLHNASLLVDDVEDNSSLRRGIPVAHNIFGVPQTINSSNYIYFLALQEVSKLSKNQKAVAIFSEELVNLHRGQGMDLFWRDTLTCPTEDDYLEMVTNKTGGLFRLAIKLMQAESRSLVDCVPLVNILGLVFQIRDDYQNLHSRDYTANKGMCEDLTEGKFSFPVIHSVRADPANLQLLNILKQRTANEEVKRYAVAYMESTGSFEYTRRVLSVLIDRARRLVDQLDEGRGKSLGVHQILDKLDLENFGE